MKKVLKRILICFLAIILLIKNFLIVSLVVYLLSWQCKYVGDHDFITIMGEEYYFTPVFFQHSEREFRKVHAGITYKELVKKFGRENGQLNSNGIKNSVYYALAEDRFVVFILVSYLVCENGVITEKLVAWRIILCDDKEVLEVLSEDKGIYEAAIQTWDLGRVGDRVTTN